MKSFAIIIFKAFNLVKQLYDFIIYAQCRTKVVCKAQELPRMSFLFPWTKSFPATFTKESFNCFPIRTTWLQFSTFLNGIFIGGLVACFQLTDPGDTFSSTSRRVHLHIENGLLIQKKSMKLTCHKKRLASSCKNIWIFFYWTTEVQTRESPNQFKCYEELTHFWHPQTSCWHMSRCPNCWSIGENTSPL